MQTNWPAAIRGERPVDMTSEPAHLRPSELAGYLDRQLDGAGRARVEAHLDSCAACREELAEVARLSDVLRNSAPAAGPSALPQPARQLLMRLALGGALAASLALVVLRLPPSDPILPTAPVRAPA